MLHINRLLVYSIVDNSSWDGMLHLIIVDYLNMFNYEK